VIGARADCSRGRIMRKRPVRCDLVRFCSENAGQIRTVEEACRRREIHALAGGLFNRANSDLPNRIFGTANFGRIFSATNLRECSSDYGLHLKRLIARVGFRRAARPTYP
jgi:hypothetical protein